VRERRARLHHLQRGVRRSRAGRRHLEALVRRKVDEGHYSTEDEVVADALRLMQARDEVAQIKRTRLQDAVDRGYQDVAAGKVTRLESDDQIDAFFADL
jgi:antitoxin ParD1/3/4